MDLLADVAHAAKKTGEWSHRHDDAIEAAYAGGHGLGPIAEASGLTIEGVRQLLMRRGVQLRPQGRPARAG